MKLMGEPEIPMYVLTNESLYYGAATLFYPDVQEMLAEKFGRNYYVLPSSINEVMIVPDNGIMDYKELRAMVNEVNRDQVDEVEVLTGEVYYYDLKAKELSIAGSSCSRDGYVSPNEKESLVNAANSHVNIELNYVKRYNINRTIKDWRK